MPQIQYLKRDRKPALAYVHHAAKNEALPAVIFLGGFKSDMEGTKALFLEEKCCARGQEFLRFDYSGHGSSGGAFVDGTIDSWLDDAQSILDKIVHNKHIILIGSSMGGWIALKLLLQNLPRIKSVVGIAAAPDFTRDIKAKMSAEQQKMIEEKGRFEEPNDYSDDPYIFTKTLLDDGEEQSLLHGIYETSTPITLLQGKLDNAVPWEKAEKIKHSFGPSNVKIIYIEDGDHSLSRNQDLEHLNEELETMLEL